MHTGKCPKCGEIIEGVNAESIDLYNHALEPTWHGISFVCPSCHVVLGVGIDLLKLQIGVVS
jgi:predicted RNA-binding Zn-ribbon protein involved in translation (DUF1610 family)